MFVFRMFIVRSLFVAPITGLVIIIIFVFWNKPNFIRRLFLFMGEHSINMWLTHLSNFTMIINAIVGILAQITSAISASLGNFFAQEDREEGYRLFQRVEFLNYWLYGFSMIALIVLMNPFVELWIGKKFVLSQSIVIALAIRFLLQVL